ncbi:Fur family transcriptional regulator [Campylobacter sp.]|uniref:Fur family transcriptional regulator n=1 Tax=Campylobacter sp. TaxID=205 RepID=UPI00360C05DE
MGENLEEKVGFEELLTKNDIKITPLRLEILHILHTAAAPLSYDEILAHMGANKTTFYRCMDLFEAKGIVLKSENNRKNFYELESGAKAYFVCDVCHKMTNIDMPRLKQNHVKSVVVKGVCDECF